MQEASAAIDLFGQAYAPQRRCAPVSTGRTEIGPAIGKSGAHVMQEQIRVRPDGTVGERRQCIKLARPEFGHMTLRTFGGVEELFTTLDGWLVAIARCGRIQ